MVLILVYSYSYLIMTNEKEILTISRILYLFTKSSDLLTNLRLYLSYHMLHNFKTESYLFYLFTVVSSVYGIFCCYFRLFVQTRIFFTISKRHIDNNGLSSMN